MKKICLILCVMFIMLMMTGCDFLGFAEDYPTSGDSYQENYSFDDFFKDLDSLLDESAEDYYGDDSSDYNFGWLLDSDEDVEENITNTGDGTYTIMIYMCGSDLESDGAYATSDISEMLKAYIDEKVNVIIETGGSKKWQRYGIANNRNQIYQIKDNKLNLVNDNLGKLSMTKASTLENFIKYCKQNYSAEKYGLIMWDHGGGSAYGYGYDQNNSDEDDTLLLSEMKQALKNANVDFEFVGFDACLMGSFETAYALKDNAKYLIASEESEPGSGWAYTKLFNTLSKNTSQEADALGKEIVDSFISSNNSYFYYDDATLSVIDLSKIDEVYTSLTNFMSGLDKNCLQSSNQRKMLQTLGKSKSFGEGEYDLIDIIDFAQNFSSTSAKSLVTATKNAISYSSETSTVEDANGLSFYLPYLNLGDYEVMADEYPSIGITGSYADSINTFANFIAGGRSDYRSSPTSNNHYYQEDEQEDYNSYSWYDSSTVAEYQNSYQDNTYDADELNVIDKGDYYALHMDDNEWDLITDIKNEVLYDDGEGYIDCGEDYYYAFDDDGDLKVTFDGVCIMIDDILVPFYPYKETDEYVLGKVPAYLNNRSVNLILMMDLKTGYGEFKGAEVTDEYGNTNMYARGMIELKENDTIKFVYDYYTYDGDFDDSYFSDEIKYNSKLEVCYTETSEDTEFLIYYKLTDIYGNEYYTQSVSIY